MAQPTIKIPSNRGLLIFSVFCGRNFSRLIFLNFYFSYLSIHISYKHKYLWKMTRYMYISLNFFKYAQKSFTYVAEALPPLLRLGTFSWIVARDSHEKILNSQPCSRPTRQRSAAHQWAAAHRLRTAGIDPVIGPTYNVS